MTVFVTKKVPFCTISLSAFHLHSVMWLSWFLNAKAKQFFLHKCHKNCNWKNHNLNLVLTDLQSKSHNWLQYETFFAEILPAFGQKHYNSRTLNLFFSIWVICTGTNTRFCFFSTTVQLTLKKPRQVSVKFFQTLESSLEHYFHCIVPG